MQIPNFIKPWLGRKSALGVLIITSLIVLALFLNNKTNTISTETSLDKPLVTLTTSTKYAGGQSLSLIGSVRAFSEAIITSERAGRVVGVNVTLGQYVSAGTVLATLENASERASVLQAEGVYDSAVAAAAQSAVGVDEAKNALRRAQDAAVSAFKSSYNTTNGVVRNSIDQFFANPNTRLPGLRIDGRGFTAQLNTERVAYQTLLPAWQSKVNTISPNSDLETEIEYAKTNVQRTINFVDTFIYIFNQQKSSSGYTDAELTEFSNTFTNLRSTLISVQSNLDSALSSLSSADDTVRRAELAASGSTASVADAQVKQALGSLRAAQANLAKTILRSPISGTINFLSLRTGDFINSFAQVAVVANNNALEIITSISDMERDLIKVGDEVIIEGKFTGYVTEIAPAVNSLTRKIEVRIATENTDIANGDTVRITKKITSAEVSNDLIRIPLTAVKFERENGYLLVVENGSLSSKQVSLGSILGNSVEITEGLSSEEEFVLDVRGLISGEQVEVKQ